MRFAAANVGDNRADDKSAAASSILAASNNRFQQNTDPLGGRRLYFLWMGRE